MPPPLSAGRLSLDSDTSAGSAASDARSSITCRSQASVDLCQALLSVLPPEWSIAGEALVILHDHETHLTRLLFSHPVLPCGHFIVIAQDFAENVPRYDFCLVHRDIDDAAAAEWRRGRAGDGDDDEPYVLSSKDFSELGVDEKGLNDAIGVLEPWLETADDYMVCSLPNLDDVEDEGQLPAGSLLLPGNLIQSPNPTGKFWFNQSLPFGWCIYQRTDGTFVYADTNNQIVTTSHVEMRRQGYLASMSGDNAWAEREGGWARDTVQDFLQDLEDIEGNDLPEADGDDESVEKMIREGSLPDGPTKPPPGSAPFDRAKVEDAAVLFHQLLPLGWLMVKHPSRDRFVYVQIQERRATYLYQSAMQRGRESYMNDGFDRYNESTIDNLLPNFDDSSDDDSGDGGNSNDDNGDVDLSNLNEKSQQDRRKIGARLGMKRERKVAEDPPSEKKKRTYSYQERVDILERWDAGYRPRCLKSSVSRWRRRLCRYLPTGNKARPGVSGTYQFLLVLFKLAYPGATAEEAIVFVAESAPTPKIFTPSQIAEALKRLGMTRKRCSTDATQAFAEVNLMKRHIFWNTSWPTGVVGTERWRLIDADECGIELRSSNHNYGHSVKNLRVRLPGNYTKSTKFTVLLGIEAGNPSLPDGQEGSVTNPRRYVEINQKPGTTGADYCDFVTGKILKSFGEDEPQRTLMHDNLSSHLDPALYDAITKAGHRALCRPPWVPSDGPVEWAFNQLGCELRNRSEQINDEEGLIWHIRDILLNLKGMDKLFEKCGY